MNFVYSILNHMKNNSEFNKKLVILISFLLCLLVGLYIHIYLKQDIIYTHLFYIPIILTAFWYGIKSLYLALLVGLLHIGLNYMTFVTISVSSGTPGFNNYSDRDGHLHNQQLPLWWQIPVSQNLSQRKVKNQIVVLNKLI